MLGDCFVAVGKGASHFAYLGFLVRSNIVTWTTGCNILFAQIDEENRIFNFAIFVISGPKMMPFSIC
jgi:hypothetical protein